MRIEAKRWAAPDGDRPTNAQPSATLGRYRMGEIIKRLSITSTTRSHVRWRRERAHQARPGRSQHEVRRRQARTDVAVELNPELGRAVGVGAALDDGVAAGAEPG